MRTRKPCREIPSDMIPPTEHPLAISPRNEEELDAELEKGYQDLLNGQTKPAGEVFAHIRRKYGL